jgi:hypothetical protein
MPTINMQILGVDNPVAVELGIVDLCTYGVGPLEQKKKTETLKQMRNAKQIQGIESLVDP